MKARDKLVNLILSLMDDVSEDDVKVLCDRWSIRGFKSKALPVFLAAVKEIDPNNIRLYPSPLSTGLLQIRLCDKAIMGLDALSDNGGFTFINNVLSFSLSIKENTKQLRKIILKVIYALPNIAENVLGIKNVCTSSTRTPIGLILSLKDYEPVIGSPIDLAELLFKAAEYINYTYDLKKPSSHDITSIVDRFVSTSFDEEYNSFRMTAEDLVSLTYPNYPEVSYLIEYITESKEVLFKADSRLFH